MTSRLSFKPKMNDSEVTPDESNSYPFAVRFCLVSGGGSAAIFGTPGCLYGSVDLRL